MPGAPVDVEKRYTAGDAVQLPPLGALLASLGDGAAAAGGGGPVVEADAEQLELRDTYFDTADLRLAAAGLSLHRRTGGDDAGWHVGAAPGAGAGPGLRLPLGRAWRTVPESLRRMIRVHSRGALLQPVAEVTTERTVRRLIDATGLVVVELADDRVSARRLPRAEESDGAGARRDWREVGVELAGGAADLLADVDARLRHLGLGDGRGGRDLARVLGTGRGPGGGKRERRREELTAKAAAGAVVLAHVREQVAQIRAQDLPVRLDAPDGVHKMRVATRRLRSALTTFRPLFDADVVRPLRGELKWLAAELGAARDAEVMRDRVAATVAVDRELDPAAAQRAVDELARVYREAHDRVLVELDGERYHRLVEALDALVADPPFRPRAARRAGEVLPPLVGRSFTVVRTLVADAEAHPAGAEREELLHDARKAAKAARYAGESVSRVFGSDATAFAGAMEAVQEALGEHQDSVLTRERLRTLGLSSTSVETAFLYGRLHALEETRAEGFRDRFDEAWAAAARRSLHRWTR